MPQGSGNLYRSSYTISPSDSVDLPFACSVYVGGGGDIKCEFAEDARPSELDHITVTNTGTGYHQATTTVAFSGGSPTTPATADVVIQGGLITHINIVNPGIGYSSAPTITITDTNVAPGVSGAATAVLGAPVVLKAVPVGSILPFKIR